MLRVHVLGDLELERDGEPLEPPQRGPARSLLGWLALHPGVHSRAAVAAALWPRVLDTSARASLRTALSALRAAVGPDAVVAGRTSVGLARAPHVWIDVDEFDGLRAAGRAQEALALCRGELLAGIEEDWALAARDAHRDAQGELLATLARHAARAGDVASAITLARRRAALDPFDERAHRELLALMRDAGDTAGALVAHERFAERLRRQLGAVPAPATRELVAGLRAPIVPSPGSSDRGATTAPAMPARLAAARRRRPLVGRAAQLAELGDAWRRSAPERRAVVLITGEPGIGKTRLAAEHAQAVAGDGGAVLYGRAQPRPIAPYEPFIECLHDSPRGTRVLPEEIAALSELVSGHAEDEPLHDGAADPGARLRLFDAVGALLDSAAADRPVLLVLDDLHWADHASLDLLVHVASRPDGAPRMLVVTYRDTDLGHGHPLPGALAHLRREVPIHRIALDGLDAEAVATMVGRRRSRPSDTDAGAARELHARTGGNPLYVELLLDGGDAAAPAPGIAELVARRLEALDASTQAILHTAAVAGPEFDLAVVAEAARVDPDVALEALEMATRARIVVEVPGDPGRCSFAHAVLRETLAASLTAAWQADAHERLVAALVPRAETQPDRYLAPLADQALEAAAGGGDAMRAADLAERAARRAGALLAHDDAAALLRRALDALEHRLAPAARRAEIACALVEALSRAGRREPARAALAKAEALARTADRPDLLGRAALAAHGTGVAILGVDEDVVGRLERAVAALGSGAPALRARLLARLAIELAYATDADRRHAVADEASTLARRADDPAALAAALHARHVVLWAPEHAAERLALTAEMLALAHRAGDVELALQARNWRVVDLLELGDAGVAEEIDAYAVLCADTRLPTFAWYVPLWRATLALIAGRFDEGMDLARRARDLGRRAGDANAEVFFAEHQLLRLVVDDRVAEVDAVAAGVGDVVADRAGHGPAWRAYRLTFAWIHAERGEHDQARRHYDAALAGGVAGIPNDVNRLATLTSAAHACVLLGDVRHAPDLYAALAPHIDMMVITARGAAHQGSVAHPLARLAAARGDRAQALRLLEHAEARDAHAGATALAQRDRHAREALSAGSAATGMPA